MKKSFKKVSRRRLSGGYHRGGQAPGSLEPRRTDLVQVLRAYAANILAWRRLP